MNEAIANYARAKVEKSEDSGVESGHSLDNTGGVGNTLLLWFHDAYSNPFQVQKAILSFLVMKSLLNTRLLFRLSTKTQIYKFLICNIQRIISHP